MPFPNKIPSSETHKNRLLNMIQSTVIQTFTKGPAKAVKAALV